MHAQKRREERDQYSYKTEILMAVLCGSRDFGHFFIILVPSLQIASFFYSEHMLLSLYFPPSLEWAWSTAAIQLIWGSWAGLDRGESFCPLPFGSFPLFHSQALQTHPQLQFSKTEWPCLIRGFSHHIISRSLDPSLQFSRSVVSDSLQPHESQHARPPCPSPTPRVYSNSCPSSR